MQSSLRLQRRKNRAECESPCGWATSEQEGRRRTPQMEFSRAARSVEEE